MSSEHHQPLFSISLCHRQHTTGVHPGLRHIATAKMSCGLLRPGKRAERRPELDDLLDLQLVPEKSFAGPTEDEMQDRLRQLRSSITESKIDWLLVPHEDAHQSEMLNAADERLRWISNFAGAGLALIPSSQTEGDAVLFVGAIYWIEGEASVPRSGWKVVRAPGSSAGLLPIWTAWLRQRAADGVRLGVDPRLVTADLASGISSALDSVGATLVPLETNPIDRIADLPPFPANPIVPYPETMAGEEVLSKLARVRDALGGHSGPASSSLGAPSYAYILSLPAAIAWLLNIRCPACDSPYTPAAFMYLVLTPDRCAVFVDEQKVQDEELRNVWDSLRIEVQPYDIKAVGAWVQSYGQALRDDWEKQQLRVLAPSEVSWAVTKACEPVCPRACLALPVLTDVSCKSQPSLIPSPSSKPSRTSKSR